MQGQTLNQINWYFTRFTIKLALYQMYWELCEISAHFMQMSLNFGTLWKFLFIDCVRWIYINCACLNISNSQHFSFFMFIFQDRNINNYICECKALALCIFFLVLCLVHVTQAIHVSLYILKISLCVTNVLNRISRFLKGYHFMWQISLFSFGRPYYSWIHIYNNSFWRLFGNFFWVFVKGHNRKSHLMNPSLSDHVR